MNDELERIWTQTHGLASYLPTQSEKDHENTSVWTASDPAEIQIKHFPNKSRALPLDKRVQSSALLLCLNAY